MMMMDAAYTRYADIFKKRDILYDDGMRVNSMMAAFPARNHQSQLEKEESQIRIEIVIKNVE
jgi:hypothetical protein